MTNTTDPAPRPAVTPRHVAGAVAANVSDACATLAALMIPAIITASALGPGNRTLAVTYGVPAFVALVVVGIGTGALASRWLAPDGWDVDDDQVDRYRRWLTGCLVASQTTAVGILAGTAVVWWFGESTSGPRLLATAAGLALFIARIGFGWALDRLDRQYPPPG